jgi:hypothetical protein
MVDNSQLLKHSGLLGCVAVCVVPDISNDSITLNFNIKRPKQHSSWNPQTSKMKAAHFLKMSEKLTPMTQRHIPTELNPQNKTS